MTENERAGSEGGCVKTKIVVVGSASDRCVVLEALLSGGNAQQVQILVLDGRPSSTLRAGAGRRWGGRWTGTRRAVVRRLEMQQAQKQERHGHAGARTQLRFGVAVHSLSAEQAACQPGTRSARTRGNMRGKPFNLTPTTRRRRRACGRERNQTALAHGHTLARLPAGSQQARDSNWICASRTNTTAYGGPLHAAQRRPAAVGGRMHANLAERTRPAIFGGAALLAAHRTPARRLTCERRV